MTHTQCTRPFNKGDGVDTINDASTGPEASILVFGEGFDRNVLKLRPGSLLLDMGDGDAIHIENFDRINPLASPTFEAFQFADGSSLSWEELLAKGFDIDGTEGDDNPLIGTGVDDRIDGRAGNDLIYGLDGNDIIIGGTGADGMNGGLGDDTYIVRTGEAQVDLEHNQIEVIADDGGNDTLTLDGVGPATIQVGGSATPGELRIEFGAGDQLAIVDGIAGAVENFLIGTEALTTSELIGRYSETVLSGNDANGHQIIHGGQRDDTLSALAGHATLSGGRGNDVLIGSGGNNSYLYSIGDGTDSLTDTSAKSDALGAAQVNTLTFGPGIGADDIKLGVSDSGALMLHVGQNASDAIYIEGFDPASPTGAVDSFEFTDGTTLTYADLIARGTDITGTAGDDVLTGTVLHDRLSGGAGNDTYRIDDAGDEVIEAANEGNDTVESSVDYTLGTNLENLTLTGAAITGTGNALDNRLAGNALDNTLAGGAGMDTYRLSRHSGSDLVIDSGANRIQLVDGLGFDDLAATRDGDDLRLAIRGDSGAMRLQGYFSDGTAWQVSDDSGAQSDSDTLLAQTAAYQEDRIVTLARDFLATTRLGLEQNLAASGYALRTDGTWSHATQYADGVYATQTDQMTTTTNRRLALNHTTVLWTSSGVTHDITWTQPGAAYRYEAIASIGQSRVSAGDATVYSSGGDTQYSSQWLWAEVRWGAPQAGGTTHSSQSFIQPWTFDGMHQWLETTTTYDTTTTSYQGSLTGRYLTGAGAGNPPTAVSMRVDSESQTYRLEEIDLTAGDHVVYADAYAAVIGGTGNNTIYGAGFAYGGTGNSTIYNATYAYGGTGNARLIGGTLLVAGTGDQWLENGATMVVGDGHDTVIASAGQVVQAGRDNTGRDLVLGQGDQTFNIVDATYQAQGIVDWQEGYEHGGQYYLSNLEAGAVGYYDSLADLASGLQPWASVSDLLRWGEVRRIDPLPFLVEVPGSALSRSPYYAHTSVPTVTLNTQDFGSLQHFYDAGVLVSPKVSFGEGIVRADLQFSWGLVVGPIDHSRHVTLDIGWGTDQGIRVVIPHFDDAIGSTVNAFDFADGSRASLADLVALAPSAPDFDPEIFRFMPGSGAQTISSSDYSVIGIKGGQSAADFMFVRDGNDLVLSSVVHRSDELRVVHWYGDAGELSSAIIKFDDGTFVTASQTAWLAPLLDGSAGDQTLTGLDGFANVFMGGNNDTLVGGGGYATNTFIFNLGNGHNTIVDGLKAGGSYPGDVIQFGAGITIADTRVFVQGTDLRVDYGTQGDSVLVKDFAPSGITGSQVIGSFRFADGSHGSYTNDGNGNGGLVAYDAAGTMVGRFRSFPDGAYETDVFMADGSSRSVIHRPDGSYGTGTSNADGSSSGTIVRLDGSYDTYTDDGHGNRNTASHDAAGNILGFAFSTDDGLGNHRTSYQDPNGLLVGDSWVHADGSHGTDSFSADGSTSASIYNPDGSGTTSTYDAGTGVHGYQARNADGSFTDYQTTYDGNGGYQQSWTASDGSSGENDRSADGSMLTVRNNPDGSGMTTTFDASTGVHGYEVRNVDGSFINYQTTYDGNGGYQQVWTASDGSSGENDSSADGSTLTVHHNPDGSGTTSSFDASTGVYGYEARNVDGSVTDYQTTYDGSGGYQQSWTASDGSSGQNNQAADGSTLTVHNNPDGSGTTSTFDASTGVYGYEARNADGSFTDYQTTYDGNGGYRQSWTASDGSSGENDRSADGSTLTARTNADGSANSIALAADGTVLGSSWATTDGRQGVDAGGNHLLVGGADSDTLTGGNGNALLIGGAGDLLVTGSGTDVIAFNQGDGRQTVQANSGQNNTLSLGGHFAYADLAFEKNGNDLILDVGSANSLAFKDWYVSPDEQKLVTLQVVAVATANYAPGSTDALADNKIETFDFQALVNSFDQARTNTPGINAWRLTNSLLDAHLTGSDSAALGGDLAYQYGMSGNLSGYGIVAAEGTVSSGQFAVAPQLLNPSPAGSVGAPHLR